MFFNTLAAAEDELKKLTKQTRKEGEDGLALSADFRILAARCAKALEPFGKSIWDATQFFLEHLERTEWKWNTPVCSRNGNLVAAGAFQNHVKVNFFKGASLSDPKGLFNAGLEAKATRVIDIHEADVLDEAELKSLVRGAVTLNGAKPKPSTT